MINKPILVAMCAASSLFSGPLSAQTEEQIAAESQDTTAAPRNDSDLTPGTARYPVGMRQPSVDEARAALATWESTPQKAGRAMIAQYGAPNEMTPTRMVWLNNGPWKWSILTNTPTAHDFPVAHEDVLEQAVSYKIVADRVDDLAAYDGSVVANRTQGELSARCDTEAANFLALNLAHDVSTGAKSADAARAYYAKAIDVFMRGKKQDDYMTGLKFETSSTTTLFRDIRASLE